MEKINNYWVLVICQAVYTISVTGKHFLQQVYYFPSSYGWGCTAGSIHLPKDACWRAEAESTCVSKLVPTTISWGGGDVGRSLNLLWFWVTALGEAVWELRCFGPFLGVLPSTKSLGHDEWLPRGTCHLELFFLIISVHEPLGICP